jgi:uncharacterized protein YcaQ
MLKNLREQAVSTSLFRSGTLRQAVERLGFVQADPIQAPARAQDLILRQRVKDYRVGDLERHYHRLGLEEDRLHVHGFMPRSTWRLLHPRVVKRLSALEKRVLEFAATQKRIHPADLEAHFGRKRAANDWGGHSKVTTLALHHLHRFGFLRVVGREKGIRVYEAIPQEHEPLDPVERYRQLALVIAGQLGPIRERTLRAALALVTRRSPALKAARGTLPEIVKSGKLISTTVDGVRYLWRADLNMRIKPNETVRFLAPFDPVVWDRHRFEHFWGWPYRFEAYVPAAKRQLGYYALPLLWRDEVIGWVNVSNREGRLNILPGFRKEMPTEQSFAVEFDAEVERLRAFLQPRSSARPDKS